MEDMKSVLNNELLTGQNKDLATNSTYRTIRILEVLSYYQGITLEELAPILELSKATLSRFLQTLSEMEYIEKSVDNKYFLTPKLFAAASRSLSETELSKIALPYMEDMSYRTGETSLLAIRDGNSALYLTRIESKYNLKFYEGIGMKIPLYCTAMGKVLLTGVDKEELDRFFATEQLIPYTEKTIVDKAELLKDLEEVRRKGFSVCESEYEDGNRSIAVPVYNHVNKIIAALGITWPLFRETSEKFQTGLESVQKYASKISMLMGQSK